MTSLSCQQRLCFSLNSPNYQFMLFSCYLYLSELLGLCWCSGELKAAVNKNNLAARHCFVFNRYQFCKTKWGHMFNFVIGSPHAVRTWCEICFRVRAASIIRAMTHRTRDGTSKAIWNVGHFNFWVLCSTGQFSHVIFFTVFLSLVWCWGQSFVCLSRN